VGALQRISLEKDDSLKVREKTMREGRSKSKIRNSVGLRKN
jgi:hypothetical protein